MHKHFTPMKTTNPYWPVIAVLLLTCSIVPLPGATFTVTKTADSGSGTLRQAILDANTNGDLDTIVFNITLGGGGLKTITPTTALPVIIHQVIIDGTTQPGYANTPVIELNGASAGTAVGLDLRGGNSTIRALTINRFHF